ncbi:MAG: C4-type zinc ribbon domain-containing protein [Bacteroides sp.]|nr:C4-type zinc ribbon domain-containing protein [Bacteroides sp.]MCM1414117.1 C4-type zinc ribbon domain-containing protein [Bacteroides sp.]MCM1472381.1 C4-type zinc ribbon domain-containing protein [Bacteroides sp.]
MATADKNKAEQNLSVESRLKSLYELQTILSQIDRIKTVRGELPLEVRDLEDQIEGLNTRISNYRQEIEELRRKTASEKNKIEESQSKIAIYKTQLDNVRNNREFDLLSKEIEFQTLEIELCEKHINEYARVIEAKTAEIAATEETLSDQQHILGEKRTELEEIVSETKQDEERLREQAKALEPKVDARTLAAFKRIRKNARNGLGIVYIQRNACGGCFNRIPPQKQMEIKMHKKIIVCEYCGRIMIDPELAGVTEEPKA